jgi:hypothetical protein
VVIHHHGDVVRVEDLGKMEAPDLLFRVPGHFQEHAIEGAEVPLPVQVEDGVVDRLEKFLITLVGPGDVVEEVLVFGDLPAYAQGSHGVPLIVLEEGGGEDDGDDFAAGPDELRLVIAQLFFLRQDLHDLSGFPLSSGVKLGNLFSQELFLGKTEHLFGSPARKGELPLQIGGHDGIGRAVDDVFQKGFDLPFPLLVPGHGLQPPLELFVGSGVLDGHGGLIRQRTEERQLRGSMRPGLPAQKGDRSQGRLSPPEGQGEGRSKTFFLRGPSPRFGGFFHQVGHRDGLFLAKGGSRNSLARLQGGGEFPARSMPAGGLQEVSFPVQKMDQTSVPSRKARGQTGNIPERGIRACLRVE